MRRRRTGAAAAWLIGLALQELGRPADALISYRRAVATSVEHGLTDQEALARASWRHPAQPGRRRRRRPGDHPGPGRADVGPGRGGDAPRPGPALDRAPRRRSGRLPPVTARRSPDGRPGVDRPAADEPGHPPRLPGRARRRPRRPRRGANGSPRARPARSWPPWPPTTWGSPTGGGATCPMPWPRSSGPSGPTRPREPRPVHRRAPGRPLRRPARSPAWCEARAAAEAAVAALEQVGPRRPHRVPAAAGPHAPGRRRLPGPAPRRPRRPPASGAGAGSRGRPRPATWPCRPRSWRSRTEAPPPDLLRRSRRIAAELEAQGWPVEALHVRTFVGPMALALGRPAVARTELAQAVAARPRGTADLRAQAWHATALLRVADGDRAGAKRALGRGIAVVDDYRAPSARPSCGPTPPATAPTWPAWACSWRWRTAGRPRSCGGRSGRGRAPCTRCRASTRRTTAAGGRPGRAAAGPHRAAGGCAGAALARSPAGPGRGAEERSATGPASVRRRPVGRDRAGRRAAPCGVRWGPGRWSSTSPMSGGCSR